MTGIQEKKLIVTIISQPQSVSRSSAFLGGECGGGEVVGNSFLRILNMYIQTVGCECEND